MQERVRTSFIPKASLQVERERPRAAESVALVNTIAGVILVLVLVASAGIFLFERFTIQQIANKKQSLQVAREAFQPATIRELVRLNTRIETGKRILAEHVALSNLFDDLETRTLASVRFSNLSYDATGSDRVTLTMDGSASSFNAVALQAGEFGKSKIITDPIFSNVNIDSTGVVRFTFKAVVDLGGLRFRGAAVPSAATTSGSMGLPHTAP